jgi:radical SAM protein with 4Fe4S-binding SPASM domain
MCNRPSKDAPMGDMDLSLAGEVLRAASENGIESVGFHTMGEILLYPYIKEVFSIAKGLGFPINISTNANLLTREKSDMLLDIGIDNLWVSLEGIDNIYNSIRQGGDFSTVIENIKYYVGNLKDKNKAKVNCHYVITKETVLSIKQFQEKYAYLFDKIHFVPVINQGCRKNGYVTDNSIILFKNDRYPCLRIWSNMFVTFNGDVSACCVDYNHKLIVGNIKRDSLLNIWNSNAYRLYRKLNRQGKINQIQACNNCTMPIQVSTFHMKRIASVIRRDYGLDIKVLDKY